MGLKKISRLTICLVVLLAYATSAFAFEEGQTTQVNGEKFSLKNSTWIHDALGESYTLEPEFSAIYKDKKWQNWHQSGDSTLQQILDLGSAVTFKYKGKDDLWHTYAIFPSNEALQIALSVDGADPRAMPAPVFGVGGAAAGAGIGSAGAGAAGAGAAGAAAAGGLTGGLVVGGAVAGAVVVTGGATWSAHNDDSRQGAVPYTGSTNSTGESKHNSKDPMSPAS